MGRNSTPTRVRIGAGDTRKVGRHKLAENMQRDSRAASEVALDYLAHLERIAEEALQDAQAARQEAARLQSLERKTTKVSQSLNRAEKSEDTKNQQFRSVLKQIQELKASGAVQKKGPTLWEILRQPCLTDEERKKQMQVQGEKAQ